MLFQRCIGMGALDFDDCLPWSYSLNESLNGRGRYVACCLRAGTIFLVPVAKNEIIKETWTTRGNDLIMFPTPLWFLTAVNIGGAMIPADRIIYIATALLLLFGNWVLLKYTRIGLIIRAGVENRNMVNALGINVRRAFSTVFFLGGFAAGVGGVLVSVYSNGVSPLIAGSYLIYGFIVVVIGGMGSVPGSFLAAMLIGVIRQFANYYVTGLGDFVVVILLAGVLLIRPQGLLGKVRA